MINDIDDIWLLLIDVFQEDFLVTLSVENQLSASK